MTSVGARTYNGVKCTLVKARSGRGRKRAEWVISLQDDLCDEFTRLRKLGVKFTPKTLILLAENLT